MLFFQPSLAIWSFALLKPMASSGCFPQLQCYGSAKMQMARSSSWGWAAEWSYMGATSEQHANKISKLSSVAKQLKKSPSFFCCFVCLIGLRSQYSIFINSPHSMT